MLAGRRRSECIHLAASRKKPMAYDVVRDGTQETLFVASRSVGTLRDLTHLKIISLLA